MAAGSGFGGIGDPAARGKEGLALEGILEFAIRAAQQTGMVIGIMALVAGGTLGAIGAAEWFLQAVRRKC